MRVRVVVVLLAALVVSLGSAQTAFAGTTRHNSSVVGATATSTTVPQMTVRPGDLGYAITPASQAFKRTIPAPPKAPYFRGGARSRTTAPATSVPPRAAASTASPKIQLLNGLNGTSLTSAINGSTETPPDSTGAIGPNAYVEIVNSAIAVWNRTNLSQTSENSLDGFLSQSNGVPLCDPQMQWDAAANRWIFSILYCNINDSTQGFLVGWSKTTDPTNLVANNGLGSAGTGGWCGFFVGTNGNLFDYQKLGHNSNSMIIGGNNYSENPPGNPNPPFVSSQIFWLSMPGAGDISCSTTGLTLGATAQPLKNGDGSTKTFTPVPVNTFSSAGDGYVIAAYDPAGNDGNTPGSRNRLAVWHIDSAGVIHAHPDITVNSYTFPNSAPQLGSSNVLDTLDGRLTQAVGDPGGGFWTQHTVNGPGGRSAVNWYEIRVSGGVASLTQQGAISSPTDWVFNGAVSPETDSLGAVIEYNRSSSTMYPLIAARARHSFTPAGTFEAPELVLMQSTASDVDFSCNLGGPGVPCRWGDYSGASPDPTNPTVVWGVNMWIGPTFGGSNSPAWRDQIFALFAPTRGVQQLPPGATPPPRGGISQFPGSHPPQPR